MKLIKVNTQEKLMALYESDKNGVYIIKEVYNTLLARVKPRDTMEGIKYVLEVESFVVAGEYDLEEVFNEATDLYYISKERKEG